MQLAYVKTSDRGATDRLLSAVAEALEAQGVALAGVVQTNVDCVQGGRCDMDLRILPHGGTIRISQSLGRAARGCRLDTAALEDAVAQVERALEGDRRPELLIVNKFGKHEADGRGFRPVIAEALSRNVPVLTGVNGLNEARFQEFAGGAAEPLAPELDTILAWVEGLHRDSDAA
ncbi:DUF2478 domain-containing protein [Lutimaribacter marinistellae]|uniref:DUF2478 domain-containing protein n=1 Tax=Lutimaribacter marinistellae TaxID=1820329 RepID=A0ABV7TL81_9RHOB